MSLSREELLKLSPEQMKWRSRGWSDDMSPKAIERRLDIVEELRSACLWLGKAKKIDGALPPSAESPGPEAPPEETGGA